MPESQRPRMRGYGVPDDPEGTLPWPWAEERLVRSRNYWLVTVDTENAPHAMPVWGLWRRGEDQFWFSSDSNSLKAKNIAANPNVVVAADDTIEVVSV
ncbi:MAG: pyridoxamine 5'-phosphate oxidase family protein, partial [Acidimicrobiia bacterium]